MNGEKVAITVEPARRLSEVLRDQLGLTGTKVGCNAGDCGACTVLVDGDAVCACMVPAGRINGQSVTTVEGLADGGDLSSLQQSFIDHGAAQCGICTPGMLVAAKALLDKTPKPNSQEVEDALGGVLCRCTGYRKIVKAVMSVADQRDLAIDVGNHKAVGAGIARLDGVQKVNGTDLFGADLAPENALLVRVIRSPYPRAQFEFGDIEKYLCATEGLVRVLTARDIPGKNCFGVIPECADQPEFSAR
ncbi:MAG: aldehyde oxidase, partial [Gammaproteobacteria bacterium]